MEKAFKLPSVKLPKLGRKKSQATVPLSPPKPPPTWEDVQDAFKRVGEGFKRVQSAGEKAGAFVKVPKPVEPKVSKAVEFSNLLEKDFGVEVPSLDISKHGERYTHSHKQWAKPLRRVGRGREGWTWKMQKGDKDDKLPPLGTGERFKNLVSELSRKSDEVEKQVRNPAALASWIGRRKYGKEKYQEMAAAGRRKKE